LRAGSSFGFAECESLSGFAWTPECLTSACICIPSVDAKVFSHGSHLTTSDFSLIRYFLFDDTPYWSDFTAFSVCACSFAFCSAFFSCFSCFRTFTCSLCSSVCLWASICDSSGNVSEQTPHFICFTRLTSCLGCFLGSSCFVSGYFCAG